jgi:hypothetical protein
MLDLVRKGRTGKAPMSAMSEAQEALDRVNNREQDEREAYSFAHHSMLGMLEYYIENPDYAVDPALLSARLQENFAESMQESAARRAARKALG